MAISLKAGQLWPNFSIQGILIARQKEGRTDDFPRRH